MDVYLDKLELHGFKSFPEKTVLKFHKGITAVVGPNGCGKSNIVDALLWVLGEQRIKNLRGENNEDLIFNGSHTQKPLGMTEVASYFMNNGEQLYFARRYFRSGESKYILNEKYCRNKDIQDALFQMQLGERKYFIFEQGSIDRLISLKPSEKRLLIEEAAGISQYLERKKETTNKLIIAEQNLENIGILITDKDGRLRELKNQVNYVGRFRQLKTERNNYLQAMLKRKHKAFQKDFNLNKTEIEKLINQEAFQVKEISVLEKNDVQFEEKLWQTDKNLKQNQQDIFSINRNILSKKSESEKLLQQNSFNQQKIKEKTDSIESNKSEIQNLIKVIEKENRNLKTLQEQLESETSVNEKNKSDLTGVQQNIAELRDKFSETKAESFNIQGKKTINQNNILEMENKINRIQNATEGKANFIKELQKQIDDNQITQIENDMKTLAVKIDEGESTFKAQEETESRSAEKIKKLEADLRDLKNEIIGLENQQSKYSEIKKKIMGSDILPTDSQTDELLQDSINVKKENHEIIENLFYEELDAIMVTEEEGISGNKANKLLLPRKSKIPAREIEKEDGFQAFVTDLIILKNKKAQPFLKEAVLVDNIQNGIKIFQKYTVDVVTKNAEIINKDGLIIKKREKGILNVIDEIKKTENKKKELEKKLGVSVQNLKELQISYQNLSNTAEKAKKNLNSLKERNIQSETKLNELRKNRDTYLNRVKLNQSEIELLNLEKDKNQTELQKLKEQKQIHEKEHQLLEKKQNKIESNIHQLEENINNQEKNVLQKESTLNLLNERLTSSRTKSKELEANKRKLTNQNSMNSDEISNLEEELSGTVIKIENLDKENLDLIRNKEQMEKQTNILEQEFEKVNEQLKKNSIALKQKRIALDEIKENRNRMEIDFSSIKKDIFQLQDLAFKELNTELDQIPDSEDLQKMAIPSLENEFQKANDRMIKMRDSDRLNFSAESEFELLSKDHHFLLSQKEDIEKSIIDMNDAIKKIDEESQVSFLEAYKEIKKNYQKNFQILFEGGEAELMLTDENNITETGLEIKAQPPGKKLQSLRLLSGGEKALTSLAFLFALFEYKPSPFCVFDEVDASLDEANIQRFLKFVHKLKEKTQFLIITHNFKTMEEADYIYGITMNEPGISTIYSMKMTGKNQLVREDSSKR